MSRKKASLILFVLLATAAFAGELTADEAKSHVGETATVCGAVVSTNYGPRLQGQPTFLNFDRPYPHHIFTVIIFGQDRHKFGMPELSYLRRKACVTGKISLHKNRPEIIVSDPQQLKLK